MDGIVRLDRVVSQFEAWVDDSFPFPKIKIKVLERELGNFFAVANVTIRNITTGELEYISGLGESADEAVSDLLTRFVLGVRANTPSSGLANEDFEWSAHEDF